MSLSESEELAPAVERHKLMYTMLQNKGSQQTSSNELINKLYSLIYNEFFSLIPTPENKCQKSGVFFFLSSLYILDDKRLINLSIK